MNILDFAVDPHKANDGVWVALDSQTEVQVAHYNNPNFINAVRKRVAGLAKPPGQAVPEEVQDQITIEATAEAILVGWRGMKMGEADLPYSYENAVSLLSNPALVMFRERVLTISMNLENYRSEAVGEDIKKSLTM